MASQPIQERLHLELKRELRPLAVHATVVMFLQGSLLGIGLMTRLLENLFPQRRPHFEQMEVLDIWTSLALLSMFATYTVLVVATRLLRGLVAELRGRTGKVAPEGS
jgi:uncharacterized membrane protein